MYNRIVFPCPSEIEGDLIVVGGDLFPNTLLAAYRKGIFPWFSQGDPILWWSLDPRFVLFPADLHVSRSLRRRIQKRDLELTVDRAFSRVIQGCKKMDRVGQDGTWIIGDMAEAYCTLHYLGYAHSVEAWKEGRLVGGLYGVSLGGCFFGESMFFVERDASKIAFTALVGALIDANFGLIDCQQKTRHLESFGAVSIARKTFLKMLQQELKKATRVGTWAEIFPTFPCSTLWNRLLGRDEP